MKWGPAADWIDDMPQISQRLARMAITIDERVSIRTTQKRQSSQYRDAGRSVSLDWWLCCECEASSLSCVTKECMEIGMSSDSDHDLLEHIERITGELSCSGFDNIFLLPRHIRTMLMDVSGTHVVVEKTRVLR